MAERATSQPGVTDDTYPAPREARRAGIAAFIGTTIEYYDFYIYNSAAALVLGQIFFSGAPPAIGTLAAFATFWTGFLTRPLGAVIFGHFGDRYGRKTALVVTLTLTGLSTCGIGALPGYVQIGVAAPILLILLRMIQGVAIGGEWGGAVLIATEYAPPRKKLLYGAFAQQGSPAGNLLATGAFLLMAQLPDAAFESWGWRVPFLASAVLVAVGLFIRLRLAETPEMQKVIERKEVSRLPIKDVVLGHPVLVLLGVGAVTAGISLAYVKTTFALSWATTELSFDRSAFLTIISIALIAQVLVQPFGAVIASRIDIRRAIAWILLPELVLLPLMFVLIETNSFWLAALGMVLATFPHAMYYAALAGILAKVFPAAVRYTGMSLCYTLCTTVFAGTAPMVSQFLLNSTDTVWSVVALGLGYVIISLVSVIPLLNKTNQNTAPA